MQFVEQRIRPEEVNGGANIQPTVPGRVGRVFPAGMRSDTYVQATLLVQSFLYLDQLDDKT